jgi:hypothetical protein
MAKVTSRRLGELAEGDDICVNFTRVQGRNGGALVEHSGTITSVCPNSETVRYTPNTEEVCYAFTLGSKYVKKNETVIGRDARAKVDF